MSTKHTLAQHTPGPWTYVDSDDEFDIKHGVGSDRTIATVRTGGNMQIVEANARLIAAAPDLLAACKEALAMCLGNAKGKDRYDLQNLMQEVIARAEGR